jgi:hypothetical protein
VIVTLVPVVKTPAGNVAETPSRVTVPPADPIVADALEPDPEQLCA